jgi:hypothetical protein
MFSLSVRRFAPLASVILAGVVAVGLSLYVPRQFDLHHTGLLATKLVAVGDGYLIHSEVFSQYGPLLTWTQVPFLWLGQSPIVTLHIWTVVVTTLTVFLLADLGRIVPKDWKISHNSTLLTAALWIVLDPTWRTGYLTAWSSLLVALMVVGSFYLFALSRGAQISRQSQILRTVALFGSGLLVGLSPFARINAGIAAIAVLSTVLAFSLIGRQQRSAGGTKILLAGLLSGFAVPVIILLITGSLASYWQQAVIGPLQWAQSALEPTYWNTWSGLQDRLVQAGNRLLPLFFLMLLVLLISSFFKKQGRVIVSKITNILAIVILTGLALYLTGVVDLFLRFLRGGTPDFPIFERYGQISWGLYHGGQYFLIFSFVALAFLHFATIVRRIVRTRGVLSDYLQFDLLLWGYALALLIQIIPTTDSRHAWWGMPLVLLAIVTIIYRVSPNPLTSRIISVILLISFLPATIAESIEQLSRPLEAAPNESFGSGAQVERDKAIETADQLRVAAIISSDLSLGPTYYMVRDGSVAAIDGVYRSGFAEFVWWASRPSVEEIIDVPWKNLVVDSWVTVERLGYESIGEFTAKIPSKKVSCIDLDSPTIYCVIER